MVCPSPYAFGSRLEFYLQPAVAQAYKEAKDETIEEETDD